MSICWLKAKPKVRWVRRGGKFSSGLLNAFPKVRWVRRGGKSVSILKSFIFRWVREGGKYEMVIMGGKPGLSCSLKSREVRERGSLEMGCQK